MMVKWNWRKSRIIFPQENEHLVIFDLIQLVLVQTCNVMYATDIRSFVILIEV